MPIKTHFKRIALIAVALCTAAGALADPLQWVDGGGFRYADIIVPTSGRTGFSKLPELETGITFTNRLSEINAAKNQILMSGSGIALGDVNGDGLCDLYACGLEGENALYLNRGGWRFEQSFTSSAISCPDQWSTGCVLADVNGNGHLDLLVNSVGGGTRLFLNDGDAAFTESLDSGLARRFGAMSMALGDIDLDGDLDLYVANYRTTTIRSTGIPMVVIDGKKSLRPEDRDEYEITPNGYIREHGEIDILYVNDGKGNFTPTSWIDGRFLDEDGRPLAAPPRDWGFSVMFRDMNLDGLPDIYVCNDFWSPERIWINQGEGRFKAIAQQAIRSTSSFSMGGDFGDYNRDSLDDIFVLDMLSRRHVQRMVQISGVETGQIELAEERKQVERNTLLLNRGDGSYTEIAQLAGIEATGWSWSTVFLDVDLDGYEDLLIGNGYMFDTQDMDAERYIQSLGPQPRHRAHLKVLNYPRLSLPNIAFRNRRDLTFEDRSHDWGFDFKGISQGMALADLDNDGDLDVVSNDMNSGLGIYRNDASAPRIQVRLSAGTSNHFGVGSRIILHGGKVSQSQEVSGGGRYLSSDHTVRTFAAEEGRTFTIEAHWPGGKGSIIENVVQNRIYEISKSTALAHQREEPEPVKPTFQDVSKLIEHRHVAVYEDDFAATPLLPWRRSSPGPAIAWFDIDSDGHDDLIVGAASGDKPKLYINTPPHGFAKPIEIDLPSAFSGDVSGIAGFHDVAGVARLVMGVSSQHSDSENASAVTILSADLSIHQVVPFGRNLVGPIAISDVDGDGLLDIFAGGRPATTQFPNAADSNILLNQNGQFVSDSKNEAVLSELGIVNGATWCHLDADKYPELIVSSEWGPVRVLENREGRLEDNTVEWGLANYTGFWNGVTSGDFNNDGLTDLLATNWGRNTPYERHREKPLYLFAGDFDQNGTIDPVEAYHDPELNKVVPRLIWDFLAKGIPYVRARFLMHRDYGMASVNDVLGNVVNSATRREANWLESSIFINMGDHFSIRPLPIEAQFTPAFAPVAIDFDMDGNEDIFLSQNFFGTRPEGSRYDAARGLWLRGNGRGGFEAVSGAASGVEIYGEQRAAAWSDFDADGRPDLAVTQHNGETKLYRNALRQSGHAITLRGSKENPNAVGATIQMIHPDGTTGPLRTIEAGSGYWSQSTGSAVFGGVGPGSRLRVRWPDGTSTTTNVGLSKRIEVRQ